MERSDDVLIVGGGVVGLACALALLEAGRGVRILEAGRVGCGSSHGNCGTITPSHAAPLAAPGAVGKALGWMFTPDAPFYVKPRLDPGLWRWMLGFAWRCNPNDWREAMVARGGMLQASRQALAEWVDRFGLECEFEASGVDYVYRSERDLLAFDHEARDLRALGIDVDVIDGPTYLRDEPSLRDGVAGVVRFPGDARLRPDRYVAELARVVRAAGGVIEEDCAVQAIHPDADGVAVTSVRGGFRGRDLVLAAGSWSPGVGKWL